MSAISASMVRTRRARERRVNSSTEWVSGPGRRIVIKTTPESRASAGIRWVRPGPATHPEPWPPTPLGWWMPGHPNPRCRLVRSQAHKCPTDRVCNRSRTCLPTASLAPRPANISATDRYRVAPPKSVGTLTVGAQARGARGDGERQLDVNNAPKLTPFHRSKTDPPPEVTDRPAWSSSQRPHLLDGGRSADGRASAPLRHHRHLAPVRGLGPSGGSCRP